MTFIWPFMLLGLLIVPLLILLYLRIQHRRRSLIANYSSFGLMNATLARSAGIRRHIPPLLFLLALIILIVALARPQTVLSLPRLEGTVVLAFDVSGSMAADDLKPTRMEAAKAAAQDFVERQPPTVTIGVVAFSDNGIAVQVPTNDQDAVLAAINRLKPQRGTSLANGILAAINAISAGKQPAHMYSSLTPTPALSPTPVPQGTHTSGVIVLLTDGENNQSPDPMVAIQAAVNQGIRIYTVGIGSAAGADLHIEGFTIHTQLEEATLQQIAQLTDGSYYNAENEEDLRNIYQNLSPQLTMKQEKQEITALLAGGSILVLLLGSALSLFWFGRVP